MYSSEVFLKDKEMVEGEKVGEEKVLRYSHMSEQEAAVLFEQRYIF
jgi:hypothetical protein